MATYAEFLKSQGASDEDLKVLDHPVARKAWEVSQAQIAQAAEEAATEKRKAREYNEQANQWFDSQTVVYKDMEKKVMAAEAEKARAIALVKSAQDAGLLEIAKGMGYDAPPPPDPKGGNVNANGFNPEQYFTRDDILRIANQEGEAIATAQDIAYQHQRLFPDKPLNFRALRTEAVSRKLPVEAVWKEKYKVDEAVAARDAADKAAYEKRLIEQGEAQAREKFASQYGNPDTRPFVPSSSPFTPRPQGDRTKQPWDANENTLANDRVARVTRKLIEKNLTN
jgi:hypothetical protein